MNPLPRRPVSLLLPLVLAASLAACGSDPAPADAAVTDSGSTDSGVIPADSSTDSSTPTDSGVNPSDSSIPTNVVVAGSVAVNGKGAANVTVTAVGSSATATTGADGQYSLMLLSGSSPLIRATRADIRAVQTTIRVPTMDVAGLALNTGTTEAVGQIFTALGLAEDATRGIVIVHYTSADALPAGFGATLSTSGGVRFVTPSDGPPRRSETTVAGVDSLVIANVPAGDVTITATAPAGMTCAPSYQLSGARVDARTITNVFFSCQ